MIREWKACFNIWRRNRNFSFRPSQLGMGTHALTEGWPFTPGGGSACKSALPFLMQARLVLAMYNTLSCVLYLHCVKHCLVYCTRNVTHCLVYCTHNLSHLVLCIVLAMFYALSCVLCSQCETCCLIYMWHVVCCIEHRALWHEWHVVTH